MTCNCAEFEILLCDAVDGALRGELSEAFREHRDSCAACNQLAVDVLGATAFLERVAVVEPPKELLTRILFETAAVKPARRLRTPDAGWFGTIKGFFGSIRQPRLAMGMAMTILSLSMLAQVFGLEIRQLRAADLEPVRIWAGVENSAHRQWSRVVKYYENIRVVYEIQSRLQEWTEQEELERQNQRKETARPAPSSNPSTSPPPAQ